MAEPKKTGPEKPGTQVLPAPAPPLVKKAPLYHVILHDDDLHTYHYVIAMLTQLFGKTAEQAFKHAVEVDKSGVTIVDTTTLERAELKRDQIKAFGRDPLIDKSTGGMFASIEPAQ
jgi:ATP-dependent Clp protease adaptor protein ClpS